MDLASRPPPLALPDADPDTHPATLPTHAVPAASPSPAVPAAPPSPARPPPGPREERARRAVEALLLVSIGATLTLATLRRASDGWRGASAPGPPWTSIPVDVARDPPWLLRLLPGLGPSRVESILAERERGWRPATVRDLVRVHGLGPRTVEALEAAGAVVSSGTAFPRKSDPCVDRPP